MTTSLRNKLIALSCAIALFIPTYIAIGSYVAAQHAPVDEKSISSMQIVDTRGSVFTLSRENAAEAELISTFIALGDGARNVGSLPDEIANNSYYRVTYSSYGIENEYQYYLSAVPTDNYYVDSKGGVYRIDSEKATALISSSTAEPVTRALYAGSAFPTLTVGSTGLKPVSASWSYTNYAEAEVVLGDIAIASSKESCNVSAAIPLDFSTQPDSLMITISDGGEVVYSGSYDQLGSLDVGSNVSYDVLLEAKWVESAARRGGGEATYSFVANIKAPAVFYLGETSIQPGEFVVITAKNVDDPTAIKFSSEPAINFTPTFFADGELAIALVPISIELPDTDSYLFTLTAGETTQQMTLTIESKTFKSQEIEITSADILAKRTTATLTEFENNLAAVISNAESTRYFDGKFIEPHTGSIRTGFGIYRTVSGNKMQYRHEGVDYIVAKNDAALAANAGKVIYVGEQTVSGLTVVIDHGYGLKSWYMHLSSASVKTGDIVATGDTIGIVGSSGFTNGLCLHYSLSVFGVPVCPYDLWDYGVLITR